MRLGDGEGVGGMGERGGEGGEGGGGGGGEERERCISWTWLTGGSNGQ